MAIVEIDGDYECGHHYNRLTEVRDPRPDEEIEGMDGWWETVVWDQLGDDHEEDEGNCTTGKVIASDDPRLAGAEYEWVTG